MHGATPMSLNPEGQDHTARTSGARGKFRQKQPEVMIRYGVREPDTLDPLFYLARIINGRLRHGYLTISAPAFIFLAISGFMFLFFCLIAPFVSLLLQIFAPQAAGETWLFSIVLFQLLLTWPVLARNNEWQSALQKLRVFTDVAISDSGIRLLHRAQHTCHEVSKMDWQSITAVYLSERAVSKLNPQARELCLTLRDHMKREIVLKVNSIRSIEERRILVDMLKSKARLVLNDTDISSIVRVGQMNDVAFTRLWSQALADRTPRLCSTVLPENTILQDGRFLIKKQIGAGGQGAVYLAEMLDIPGQPENVVLKEYVLPDAGHEVDRQRAIEQFEREVSLLNKLDAPNIVHLKDAFVEDHRAYLVLDFVDGVSLKDLIVREGPLPAPRVAALAAQMCRMLEYLHTLSPPMVHMDFTPENLMLTADNRLIVVDFNTASDVNLAKTNIIVGKQSYMAPEQYRGKVQPSCDIFALGVTMYYLLTGLEPEALTQLEIDSENESIKLLGEIVSKATNLEESNRYQTVTEMQLEVERYLSETDAGQDKEEHKRKETGVC